MSSVIGRLAKIIRARLVTGARRVADGGRPAGHGRAPGRERPRSSTADREPAATSTADSELAGFYSNLELPYGADLEAIRQARKRLMRKYHPDLHGSDPERQRVATELVKGLNRAYEGLRRHLDPEA